MVIRIIFPSVLSLVVLTGCGGGSSGTAIGGSGETRQFSGQVLSRDGEAVQSATVSLLNTDDSTVTDEAGAFELTTEFLGENPTLQVSTPSGGDAALEVTVPNAESKLVDLSILLDQEGETAVLLDRTLRAKIVRDCGQFFLNTRTVRQTSAIREGLTCVVEADFRLNGLPENEIVFELQHRGCSSDDPWQFSGAGKTGTSGPGFGEITFPFRNDEKHCVYRIVGPRNSEDSIQLSVQINTLRKEQFDREN